MLNVLKSSAGLTLEDKVPEQSLHGTALKRVSQTHYSPSFSPLIVDFYRAVGLAAQWRRLTRR